MCRQLTPWEEAVEFHGHACPGLAMGVKAGQIAIERLELDRARDEEIFAVVETDGCGVDGIQVITGCTLGKGNLFFKDFGKQAYTVARRSDGKAVRVVFHQFAFTPEEEELRQKVFQNRANDKEMERFEKMQEKWIRHVLKAPVEEICKVEEKEIEVPGKARIFRSVKCEKCGEHFMEPRGRIQDGKVVCLECYEGYSTGWR